MQQTRNDWYCQWLLYTSLFLYSKSVKIKFTTNDKGIVRYKRIDLVDNV